MDQDSISYLRSQASELVDILYNSNKLTINESHRLRLDIRQSNIEELYKLIQDLDPKASEILRTQVDPDRSRKTTRVKNDTKLRTTETAKPPLKDLMVWRSLKRYWNRIKNTPLRKKIGFTLLIPAIWSVISFSLITVFGEYLNDDSRWSGPLIESRVQMEQFGYAWIGEYGYDDGGGGYSSSLPIYIGLMAIAGAYLIKD